MQPKINWAHGWIDSSQLPLILQMRLATESRISHCMCTPAGWRSQVRKPTPIPNSLYVVQVMLPAATGKRQTLTSQLAEQAGTKMGDGKIPAKYQWHAQVFSEEAAR